jgi:F-type H+-transporting ATPase subunit b
MGFDFARGGALAVTALHDAARSSGGVDVDVNWTFVVQMALFVVLFLALKPLLFDPMLKLFEEREKRIEGAKNEAREMYREADEKIAKYEEELVGVKRSAGEERDKLRAEGQRREQAILAKVRAETNTMLDEGKVRIQKEADSLRKELDATSQALAREMASRVLGREVQ